jgi:hypothetical protein
VTAELPQLEEREKEIPRWVQIPIGLVLGLLTLALGFALTVGLLFTPNQKAPIFAIVVGLVLLFVSVWVLEKCFRLVTGRKNRGGLMSPDALRALSVFFLVLPAGGLFIGCFQAMPQANDRVVATISVFPTVGCSRRTAARGAALRRG